MSRVLRSFQALPLWVRLWMLVLMATNMAGVFYFDTPIGYWTSFAMIPALGGNLLLVLLNRGLSKAMAIPHMLFWTPLVLYIANRLFVSPAAATDREFAFGALVLLVNGVSLGFDVNDTVEWVRGKREVFGFPGEPVRI